MQRWIRRGIYSLFLLTAFQSTKKRKTLAIFHLGQSGILLWKTSPFLETLYKKMQAKRRVRTSIEPDTMPDCIALPGMQEEESR